MKTWPRGGACCPVGRQYKALKVEADVPLCWILDLESEESVGLM